MPFSPHGIDILTDDGLPALLALGSLALRAFRLAAQAPRVAIFFDMGHALLKWVAAFCAEEVSVVPVLAECYGMFPNDGSLAMLASGGVEFVPVEMTVEPKSLISIFGLCLTFDFFNDFPMNSSIDTIQALTSFVMRFGTDLKCFQPSSACKADEAFGVETFRDSAKCHYAALDRQLALVTCCSGPIARRW